MRILYPVSFNESNYSTIEEYITKCNFDLVLLKSILRQNINKSRWNALNYRLHKCNQIKFNRSNKSIISNALQYINGLQCYFDSNLNRCYYQVSDLIRGFGTLTSLNFIIRVIEYGILDIPPMNWIRHSYMQFSNIILSDENRSVM